MTRDLAPTTTVRVHQQIRRAIAELCPRRGVNAADLLEELVGRERDSALLAAMNEHFAGRSAHERARLAPERGARERTLLDGLARAREPRPNHGAP
jgi:hypothetical protein